jgi:hypothetical protein
MMPGYLLAKRLSLRCEILSACNEKFYGKDRRPHPKKSKFAKRGTAEVAAGSEVAGQRPCLAMGGYCVYRPRVAFGSFN